MSEPGNPLLTRRSFMEIAAGSVAGVTIGGLAAGCGGTDSASSTVSGGAPVRGGTLTAGVTGGSSSDTFDALNGISSTDWARIFSVSEPLNRYGQDAQPELVLANEITPDSNGQAWTIRLRKGVEFHNGKELTSDDLAYTFAVAFDPKAPTQTAAELPQVDFRNIRKIDKYTLQVPCHTPLSTFADTLAGYYFNVIPVGYDPKKPIGTGPFKFESFTPGTDSVCVRNPNYWQTGRPYVDRLRVVDYSDETSQINALLGGQADVVNNLSVASIQSLQGGGAQVVISQGGGWNPFVMRTDVKPFDDPRVREAFRLIVDRQQMVDQVMGGHGTIGNDVFAIWDVDYDRSLPERKQDIEQAKSLLRAAGQDNLTVELVTSDIAQGIVSSAQVFAEQASGAGVHVEIRKVDPGAFFGANYLKWSFTQDFWFYYRYLPQVAQATVPSGPYNETHFDNNQYTSLYNEAIATVDSDRRRALSQEMQAIDYHTGGYIIPYFAAVIDGAGPKVRGLKSTKTGIPLNNYDFANMWLAS